MFEDDKKTINSGDIKQDSIEKDEGKITFVHEIIEIFVSSFALIAPVIILFLWVYRFALCSYYNLPIFYSSLNIIRFIPVFLVGAYMVAYVWILRFTKHWKIWSLKINKISYENNQKKKHIKIINKTISHLVSNIKIVVLYLVITSSPALLLIETIIILEGKYPLIFKGNYEFEANFLYVYSTIATIFFTSFFLRIVTKRIELVHYLKNLRLYFSRKWKNIIIRVSVLDESIKNEKSIFVYLTIFFILNIVIFVHYIAILQSLTCKSYCLVEFDDTKYAIVLDTDDYYIGEPTDISLLENKRKLIIYTDAYIYLDKAENPIVVQKETFDSVSIIRE